MMRTSTSSARSGGSSRTEGTIHIYIDNSNLWIQGQKTYAEKKSLDVDFDPTWRFDVGKLKRILIERSNLKTITKNFPVKVHLYGSTPPPVDTVWNAIESHDVEVSTFARSTWSGREKQVDMAMGIGCVTQALRDSFQGLESEFIIVSGDGDLYPAIKEIVKDELPVHLWSWENALASEYRKQQDDLIQVYMLDNHLEEIGFRATTFRVDRSTIPGHSIVVLDPLTKPDEVSSFISGLTVPVHKYECPIQRENATSQDLVIIPSFARSMSHDDFVNLFQNSKAKLEAYGLGVMTYLDYRQRFFQHHPTHELSISNRFAELPGSEQEHSNDHEGQDGQLEAPNDSHDETFDQNDGFTEVKSHFDQRKKKFKMDELKSRQRCHWGFYCREAQNCKFGHTKAEEQRFKTSGPKEIRKTDMCKKDNCLLGRRCTYAHTKAEQLCTKCEQHGHGRVECPAWF